MHVRHIIMLCLAIWLGLTFPSNTRADDPATWVANSTGSFVTALCRDTHGCMWIGAKDQGLWRLDESMPPGHQISHYLTSDGLGDNTVSSLVCDKAGRIWAGTKSHGVSVFNGSQWQNFDQVTGPLRSHVVALACSPIDGSIWGATEAGLFRYAGSHWTYLTHAEGLPSDQATCLAFSKDGTLYVGTASDGIVIGSLRTHYRTWRHVYGYVKPLDQGGGNGLPSGLINCLLVGANGTVYCGTNTGLGWSVDKGVHWVYKRGGEWLDRGAGADKSGLVGDAMLCGLELAPVHPGSEKPGLAIATGKAVGGFLASQGFESGTLTTDYGTLDPKNGPTLASKELYRSQRWGTFTWTGTGLTPNAPYRVRLHFAEFWATQVGQRVFDVFANGSPVLTHLDVFRAAGGQNRALAYDFTAKADGLGRLTLAFQGSSTQGPHPDSNLLEDYITCLAEDPGGKLWIGHRGVGMEAIDEHSGARDWPGPGDDQLTNQVTAILPSTHGIWLGSTDSGLRLQLLSPVVAGALPWDANSQGQFIMAMTEDRQGHVWIGTEDQGVWRFDRSAPAGKQWTQFNSKNGLGDDNCYALTCDRLGRVWAGTLNHGVSVFNGKDWKTYGPLDGPLGSRVFAIATSPKDGDVWMSTEAGLTRYSLSKNLWNYYTRAEGLPSDQAQALAFDQRGNLFVGTDCDGIAIGTASDGFKNWRTVSGPAHAANQGSGNGLPISQINALLVSRSGTIYCGTTAGLAQSKNEGNTWHYQRGADWLDKGSGEWGSGLVDNAKVSGIEVIPVNPGFGEKPIAINAAGGTVGRFLAAQDIVGGQIAASQNAVDTKGVAGAAPPLVYQSERWGNFSFNANHLQPGGAYRVRLHFAEVIYTAPGKRIFNVFVGGQPVLTRFDIFQSAGGQNKALVSEFTARADGLGRLVVQFQGGGISGQDIGGATDLREDYVTALAEDSKGQVWVGHRTKGVEVLDPVTGKPIVTKASAFPSTDFVTALLPRPDGTLLIGGYGPGLSQMPIDSTISHGMLARTNGTFAHLPSPEPPPTLAELNAMLKTVSTVAPDKNELTSKVIALDDDWVTEGNWLGRYGRYWACLNAICAPSDYQWGAGWKPVNYYSQIGPHANPGDSLRYYVHWLYTQNPQVLELPPTYLDSRVKKGLTTPAINRREAEHDDHGETYPLTDDGPNVYTTVTVPAGLFYLSLYNYNKDGHNGDDRLRDYRLSFRPHSEVADMSNIGDFTQQPELSRGRIRYFWNGVWKRFLVRGPITLTVELSRNYSLNATLPAMMLDLVDEMPPPYFGTVEQWEDKKAQNEQLGEKSVKQLSNFHFAHTEAQAANSLFDALAQAQVINSRWFASQSRRYYLSLLTWYLAQSRNDVQGNNYRLGSHLATCYYQMGLYAQWEEEQKKIGLVPARDIEKSLRWDGISDAGQGFQVVTSYLADQKGGKVIVESRR